MGITVITCPSCQRAVDVTTIRCVYDDTPLNCINTDPVLRTRYDQLEELAAGGMGVIYKAHDIADNQIVAIKTMHLHVMTPRTVERFRIECTATSKLSHANIVVIHDYGIALSGQPYLVMDYLQGESLDELFKRGVTLESSSFFSIFSQVCQALLHAHQRSILHRDIKPGNIMLAPDQSGQFHVTVLDFGIARLIDDEEYEAHKMTKTGDVIGSPAYMSPEQARGARVDQRSDVYSLGCVMYEALTGVPPFFGKTSLETMLMHKTDVPLPMSEASLGKRLDAQLEKFVFRLLEKNPDDRYQSMADIDRDLLLLKTGRSIQTALTEPVKAGWNKKSKIAMMTASALAAGGIILFAYTHNFWQRKAPPVVMRPTTLINNDLHEADGFLDYSVTERQVQRYVQAHNPYVDLTYTENAVTNKDISQLKGASFITHLLINHAMIDDDGLQVISDLPLVELRLRLSKVKNLSVLKGMNTLTQLDLEDSPIDSSGLQIISHLANLEDLNLNGTPLHDQDLKYLSTLTKLHSLQLSNCPNLSQAALQHLKKELSQCGIATEPKGNGPTQHYNQEKEITALGKTLKREGKYEQAAAAFQKAAAMVRADPNPTALVHPADLFYNLCLLGDCQAELHHYKQATDSYRNGLKDLVEHTDLDAQAPKVCSRLSTLYEKWNLADANEPALSMAVKFRLQSEKAASLVRSNDISTEERLTNMSVLAYDYVLLRDYEKAAKTYQQLVDYKLRFGLLKKLSDALVYESHKNKTSLAKAIAIRKDAEQLFEEPELKDFAGYELLHGQNLERLGADLLPDYDLALPLFEQAVVYYAKSKVVPCADFLANLEKTADYERGKIEAKSLSLYKTLEAAYIDVGRAADATRLHKKIALMAQK